MAIQDVCVASVLERILSVVVLYYIYCQHLDEVIEIFFFFYQGMVSKLEHLDEILLRTVG